MKPKPINLDHKKYRLSVEPEDHYEEEWSGWDEYLGRDNETEDKKSSDWCVGGIIIYLPNL